MKRIIVLLLCAIFLIVFTLVGCSSSAEADGGTISGARPVTTPQEPLASSPPADDLIARGYMLDNATKGAVKIYVMMGDNGVYDHYYYRVGAAEPYLAEGTYGWTPIVDEINGIYKLDLGTGNMWEVQYYDLERGIKSDFIPLASISREYIDIAGGNYLLAYINFYSGKEDLKPYLVIQDIFTGDIIATIDRAFTRYMMPLNDLVFVNENEIFIDYDTDFVNGEYVDRDQWENVQETIKFR